MQVARPTVMISPVERILAVLASIVCLVITLIFWSSISTYQSMWPLPGLYFIEMVVLSAISSYTFLRGDPRGSFITWGAAGIISAFSIVGAFSVGFFYVPVALMFGVISILWDVRNKQHLLIHLSVFLLAGIMQSVMMFVVILRR